MEIQQHSTGHLTATLSVKVAPEDYKDQVDTQLKEYARRANLKGFRPGKVPVPVVRKMFGKSILFDELNKLLSSNISSYIKENNVQLVGEPMPITKDMDLESDTYIAYQFDYELGLASDFDINYGLAGNAPFFKVEIDDAVLDREIEDMRGRYGDMSNPDSSIEGDTLFGKLSNGKWEKMGTLNPNRIKSERLKTEMGKEHKSGDTLSLKMDEVFENDNAIRKFWETNVQGEEVREISTDELDELKSIDFNFEVRKINRVAKCEIDAALYEKAFGEDHGITDEADFRKRVAEDMEKFFNREAMRYYRTQTIKSLVEGSDISFPDEFLRNYLVRSREQVTEANINEIYPSYARSLRWKLLVEKMQSLDPSVVVNQDDIRERARQMVLSQFGSMMGDIDPERLDSFADYYLKDEKAVERMFDELLEDRVFMHLAKSNPPALEAITATDFMERLKAEN